jgi:hypothetical protein
MSRDAGFAIRGGDGNTPPPFMPGNAGLLLAGKRPSMWMMRR